MKDSLTKLKNNLQEINSTVDEVESMIWNIKPKNKQSEQQEEKRIQKNQGSVSSLWDNFKHSNIHIIGVPEGEDKEQEIGNLFEKNNYLKKSLFEKNNERKHP